jgi:hypothetical protein
MIFISAGFDAHREDDLGQLGLTEADYSWITSRIKDVARRHAGGRIVSCLEGGLQPERTGPQRGSAYPRVGGSVRDMDDALMSTVTRGVWTLTMNRPQPFQRAKREMLGALQAALDAWRRDDDARAVVLGAAGQGVLPRPQPQGNGGVRPSWRSTRRCLPSAAA